MPIKDVLELRGVSNADLLDAIRYDASLDYQRRIPEATQAGVDAVINNLSDNRPQWNEFLNQFVNRIGSIYARTQSWTNPLAAYKKGMLSYGDTVEEYMVGMLEARRYDPDRNYGEKVLFSQERPNVEVNYHKVNRQDFYKFTINEKMLKRAFLEEGALSGLLEQIMAAPLKSDNWDEFLLMASLLSQNEKNGGFFKMQVPEFRGLSATGDDARDALKTVRSIAYELPYLSTKYNAAGMPSSATPDELMLMGTPQFLASIDVDGLAPLFHADKASILTERTIPLPSEHFGIDGAQGVLTTKDFFMVFDTLLENRSQPNPAGLYDNYFMHHHQIISLSRFVPAILLTSESGSVTISTNYDVTALALKAHDSDGVEVTTVNRGNLYSVDATTTTTPEGAAVGVSYSLSGATSSRTYVTPDGVLYVAGDESSDSIVITGYTALIPRNNARKNPVKTSLTLSVGGNIIDSWPSEGELAAVTISGTPLLNVSPGTLTYTLGLPAGTKVTKSSVKVETAGSPDVDVKVANAPGGYTITITVDAEGAPKVYTITATVPAA